MKRRLACAAAGAAVAALSVASASGLAVSAARLTTGEVGTCTASAAADTYVDQSLLSAGVSFGTEQTLSVRSQALANRRALVRFDLSSCAIPAAATVTGAGLRLVTTSAPASSRMHVLHRVDSAWAETTTWNSQPAVAAASASTETGTSSGATVTWTSPSLTADVQAWVGGSSANHGWRISDEPESAVLAATVAYGAREQPAAANRPQLFVTYAP